MVAMVIGLWRPIHVLFIKACDTKIVRRRYLQTVLLSGGVCIYGCAGL